MACGEGRILRRKVSATMELMKCFKTQKQLLAIIKAFELLFGEKPTIRVRAYIIPNGTDKGKSIRVNNSEVLKLTTKVVYLKPDILGIINPKIPYRLDDTQHNFVTLNTTRAYEETEKITCHVKSHRHLLALSEAYELLFYVKPKLTFTGELIPWGNAVYFADLESYVENEEITRMTTRSIYLKYGDQIGNRSETPFAVADSEENRLVLEKPKRY